jgi:hypothetical protein
MSFLLTPRLPTTFVRPFNYIGVGQSLDFLLPKIVDHFKRSTKEMKHISGYKITVKVNPVFVRKGEVRVLRGSNQKMCEKIGEMDFIPLEETLRWMYES